MINSVSSTCRRRQALRATLITLLALTGCQGSLRSWRRDDPSLRDLVVTPHPWDEPESKSDTRGDQRSPRDNQVAQSRTSKSRGGRPNPYAADPSGRPAQSDAATDRDWQDQDAENPRLADEDADFKSIISQADPAHRALLVQLYQAMKNRRQDREPLPRDDEGGNLDVVVDDYDHQLDANSPRRLTNHRPKTSRNSTNQAAYDDRSHVAAAAYTLSDQDGPVRTASATRPIEQHNYTDDPYEDRPHEEDAYSDDGPVTDALGNRQGTHFRFNDRDDETGLPESKPRISATPKGPQEMQPPKSKRASRAVHDPVVDTGYADPIPDLKSRAPNTQNGDGSSRKHSRTKPTPAADGHAVDANFTDPGMVVPASAESSSAAEPNVQPATLRPSSRNNPRPVPEASNNSASAAANPNSPTPENWLELVDQALRVLEQNPTDDSAIAQLNHHVTKRTLHVLLGNLDQALEPIPGLQAAEQEFFRHSLQALHNSIDVRGNPVLARRWPLVLENQRTAMQHLSAVSNLEVKNAAFCSKVDGFGAVTKFPTNRFKPNEEVLLYCEVDNFVSIQIKDGYETKLRGNYEIVDGNHTRVEDVLLPEEVDFCKRPRRDYFFVYRIYMPKNIAPGRYQLRLTIEDVKGNKFGQTSLDLEIAGA